MTETVMASLSPDYRLLQHVGMRSVWFRNSFRGAAGLAIAVYIGLVPSFLPWP